MGTWGPNTFDNDVAADWLASLGPGDVQQVEAALDALLEDDSDDQFDADLCATAIAAADVVASRAAEGDDGFADLASKAQMVIIAAAGGASELADLWKEAGVEQHESWIAALQDLQGRLSGDAPAEPTPRPASVDPQAMMEELDRKLGGLTYDVQMLKADMVDEFRKMRRFIQEQQR